MSDLGQRLLKKLERLEAYERGKVVPARWLRIANAARYCEVSSKTIRRAILGGSLKASNLGTPGMPMYRISVDELETWMKEREAGPRPASKRAIKTLTSRHSRHRPNAEQRQPETLPTDGCN